MRVFIVSFSRSFVVDLIIADVNCDLFLALCPSRSLPLTLALTLALALALAIALALALALALMPALALALAHSHSGMLQECHRTIDSFLLDLLPPP